MHFDVSFCNESNINPMLMKCNALSASVEREDGEEWVHDESWTLRRIPPTSSPCLQQSMWNKCHRPCWPVGGQGDSDWLVVYAVEHPSAPCQCENVGRYCTLNVNDLHVQHLTWLLVLWPVNDLNMRDYLTLGNMFRLNIFPSPPTLVPELGVCQWADWLAMKQRKEVSLAQLHA